MKSGAIYTDRPLTEEEKRFADEHHGLMYRYFRIHQLDPEEWYDILIIPYLQAVKKYHQIEKLKSLKFEQIFFRTLDSARSNYYRDINRKKRCPENGMITSLDYLVDGEKDEHREESRWFDKKQDVETEVLLENFLNDIEENAHRYAEGDLLVLLVKMRLSGYTDSEIAKEAIKNNEDSCFSYREIMDLIRCLTSNKYRKRSYLQSLVYDTLEFGNIDEFVQWESRLD